MEGRGVQPTGHGCGKGARGAARRGGATDTTSRHVEVPRYPNRRAARCCYCFFSRNGRTFCCCFVAISAGRFCCSLTSFRSPRASQTKPATDRGQSCFKGMRKQRVKLSWRLRSTAPSASSLIARTTSTYATALVFVDDAHGQHQRLNGARTELKNGTYPRHRLHR